jgi:hypothetical protein
VPGTEHRLTAVLPMAGPTRHPRRIDRGVPGQRTRERPSATTRNLVPASG